jgi:hypothetical protein
MNAKKMPMTCPIGFSPLRSAVPTDGPKYRAAFLESWQQADVHHPLTKNHAYSIVPIEMPVKNGTSATPLWLVQKRLSAFVEA